MTNYCGFDSWEPCQTWDQLAMTGMDTSNPGLWITGGLLILGSGILFTYNHLRNKERNK